jgi:hypothetical protein
MAKLYVNRPRVGRHWDIEKPLEVLINADRKAQIGLGDTIVMDLPPGLHQVGVRLERVGSQPILVDTASGKTQQLAVGTNVSLGKFTISCLILGALPFFGLTIWLLIDVYFLPQAANPGIVLTDRAWKTALMVPALLMLGMTMLAVGPLSRNRAFVVTKVPDPHMTDEEIAELLRKLPFRVQITIRRLMIAVAISALCFWITVEAVRSTLASHFRSRANLHADMEDIFRGVDTKKADYHAALRRKYEQAAASRAYSLDPDPSAPP